MSDDPTLHVEGGLISKTQYYEHVTVLGTGWLACVSCVPCDGIMLPGAAGRRRWTQDTVLAWLPAGLLPTTCSLLGQHLKHLYSLYTSYLLLF